MLKPAFIDLSHHNVIPDSLRPAAEAGILGVIHKATEGTSFVDDKMSARHHLASDAGLLWGLYHFVRPGEIEEQARHFIRTFRDDCDYNTLACLDWEDSGVSIQDALLWLQIVEDDLKCAPVVYSGHVLKEALASGPAPEIVGYRLWLAQYADRPDLPPGYTDLWAWQYTDVGEVPGILPPTDLNAFNGTVEELRESWSGAHDEIKPKPPETKIVRVIVPEGVEVVVVSAEEYDLYRRIAEGRQPGA